jgi:hypothetical protein
MAYFDLFGQTHSGPEHALKPPAALLSKYRGKVPDDMLEFWREYDFGSYDGGLLWIVDPGQLQEVIAEWLPRTKKGRDAVCIARNAFGSIVYWHDGSYLMLDPHINAEFLITDSTETLVNIYFEYDESRKGFLEPKHFKRAKAKLGPLAADEIYSYKLPLAMGGDVSVKNMAKVKLPEALSILAQTHGEPPQKAGNR